MKLRGLLIGQKQTGMTIFISAISLASLHAVLAATDCEILHSSFPSFDPQDCCQNGVYCLASSKIYSMYLSFYSYPFRTIGNVPGQFHENFTELDSLEEIIISNSDVFSNGIPDLFQRMTKLAYFYATSMDIGGVFPDVFRSMTWLGVSSESRLTTSQKN